MNPRDKKHTTPTRDAGKILTNMLGHDADLQREVHEASLNVRIAELLLEARTHAGLTQAVLAERIGTTQSVISRLEDANYEGHSLPMLQRIAAALGRRVDIQFPPGVA